MKQILFENFGAFLGAILTGIAGFLFGKKKLQAEIAGMSADNEAKEIENADKLVKLYKEALDDLGNRYEIKFKELSSIYDSKIKLLEDEINLHKRIIAQLKEDNIVLKQKIKNSGI
ncbi:hypothetical protein D1631_17100 [Chryseobacterium nematophagum]|uniref:Cell wall anchor protein n=1 Tax=Chryseobacterium nematophagum TaxID=2305228 RepID=A0A3M7TIW9_9FLAO|nr:hypothetical protein [Chryseobacterium nematophagum]RNA63512.1 hypothetical protein D1631_17100 [Chryseobacterium nematophagum]